MIVLAGTLLFRTIESLNQWRRQKPSSEQPFRSRFRQTVACSHGGVVDHLVGRSSSGRGRSTSAVVTMVLHAKAGEQSRNGSSPCCSNCEHSPEQAKERAKGTRSNGDVASAKSSASRHKRKSMSMICAFTDSRTNKRGEGVPMKTISRDVARMRPLMLANREVLGSTENEYS